VRSLAIALLTALAIACSRPPPDATPEGALRAWIEEMQSPEPESAKAAYALLGASTHAQLEKRAERSSRIEGHRIAPYEVLAQGRFALRFRPAHFVTTTSGNTANVVVTGEEPTDTATIRCSKEGKVWRVELDLPELLDLPHRQE
jgi:hypothetical protein